MKRITYFLPLIAVVATGCVTTEMNVFKPKDPPIVVAATEPEVPPPPPPIVTVSQITEKNAPEMIDALRAELDYAATDRTAPAPARTAVKK